MMMNTLVHISVSMKYLSYISSAKSLCNIPQDHLAPPSNKRRPRSSQEQSMHRDEEDKIPDVTEDEYPQSYTGKSFGNGKTKVSVQRPSRSKSRPRVVDVHSSPPSVVDSPIVQRMDPNTRQAISQATKRWLDENDTQSMAGNTMAEDDDSDNSGHFSSHGDSMSTRMANLSIRDPISPHRPNDTYHPQPATSSSPYPPTITGKRSESHKLPRPQAGHTMGSTDLRQAGTLHHDSDSSDTKRLWQFFFFSLGRIADVFILSISEEGQKKRPYQTLAPTRVKTTLLLSLLPYSLFSYFIPLFSRTYTQLIPCFLFYLSVHCAGGENSPTCYLKDRVISDMYGLIIAAAGRAAKQLKFYQKCHCKCPPKHEEER